MKPSTYLETSVIGAYLDNGEPFRRDLTIRWWEHELSEYRAVISPLVISELELERRGLRYWMADPNLWVPFDDGTAFGQWRPSIRPAWRRPDRNASTSDLS